MTARRFEALLLGLALGAVLMLLARSQDFGRLTDEIAAREDSIAALEPRVRQLTQDVEYLSAIASQRDTVLLAVTDTVTVQIRQAVDDYHAAADSLRATLDSVQSVHLANIESSHRAEVRALQRLTDETRLWGESWKALAVSQDSLIAAQSAQIALHSAINQGLRRAYARQQVAGKATQLIAVVGAGKVCYDAINDGRTGLAIGSCAVTAIAAAMP